MRLKDMTTNKYYTTKNLECHLIVEELILIRDGKVTLTDGGEFCFESGDKLYKFRIADENEKIVVLDRFKQGCANIACITISSNDKPVFFLDICFFPRRENFGNLDIIVGDKITDTLLNKKVIKQNEDYFKAFTERFALTDGYKKCFIYGTGYLPFEEDDEPKNIVEQSIENEYFEDDTLDTVAGHEEEKKVKSFIIYGNDLTLYVSLIRDGENEVAVAEKIVIGKVKNDQSMMLGYGELNFVRESSYISGKVKDILSESSEYLDVWNNYAKLEGKFLLDRVRKIGLIKFVNTIPDNNGYIVNLIDSDVVNALNIGDYLMLSESIPPYLEDTQLTWDEYRELLKSKELLSQTKPKETIQLVEIIKINNATKSLIIKTDNLLSLPCLSLAITGEAKQIERREDARKKIADGQSAMPTLGLILEGKGASSGLNDILATKINRTPALSAFVKDKIFKNDPTDTQVSAIDIALNTPDIAVIQGPPGTGKTTVITAIIERLNELFDKRESVRGQVLITSFQHDAVENVIQRLRINSLPTIKFGKRSRQADSESQIDRMIDEWFAETASKIRSKNLQINQAEEYYKFVRSFEFYEMAPSDSNARAFLESAKKVAVSAEVTDTIDNMLDSLSASKEYIGSNILNAVRKLRITEIAFVDDGSDTALALYDALENLLDVKDKENAEILRTLKIAAQTDGAPSKELLTTLKRIRRILLERLIPLPSYRTEKLRSDIIELYNTIKKSLRKPQNEVDCVILDFLTEIENNPISVHKALADYSFVFSASTQQSVGKEIADAKNKKVNYDTVIVDEAARANPGDLMIPLTQAKRRIILVGDHRQLPHIFDEEIVEQLQENDRNFNIANIEISMFEQLMLSAKKLEQNDGIRRTITLDAQYRMHRLLGNFVNDNFYKPYGESFGSPLPDEYFHQNLFKSPAIWMHVDHDSGDEEKIGTSRRRFAEINVIVSKIKEMLSSEVGKGLTYGVISFYSAQVAAIKNALDDDLKEKVRVGSVDAFQGMEFDVIFLSVVRTRKNMPTVLPDISDEKLGVKYFGFMTSENRLCVAMSRQKKLLIAVGDSKMFKGEIAAKYVPAMKNYYELCEANGGVIDVR